MAKNTNLFYLISRSPIGALWGKVSSRYPNIILAYHGVQREKHPRCIETDLFVEHMKFIKNNWDVLPINDLVRGLGCDAKSPSIAVTFDDAYRNLIDEAIPTLVEMNIPATIYVPLKYIGKRNEWDKKAGEPMLPILSCADLESIIRETNNIAIGSHGVSHCRLAGLSRKKLQDEIMGSKKDLQDMFGVPIESIAYPHGGRLDYDAKVLELVATAGYRFAVSTRFGRHNKENEIWHLCRVLVRAGDDLERFKAKLEGKYDWICMKQDLAFRLRSSFKGFQKRKK